MFRRIVQRLLVAVGVVLLAGVVPFVGTQAYATDGHFLHGVGAVNQSMGGAGFALSESLLGTYYLNPAALTRYEGTQIEFGFELFKADRSVSSAFGENGGTTRSKSEFVPIPAMAFSAPVGDKMVVGLGGLGIGGFGVDYPAAVNNNFVLAPRPNGFGQVYSNFSLLKFTPALAYQVNDQFSIGFSVNVSWATLAVDPAPFASPAVTMGDGMPQAYYSRATAADGAFGFGFQIGALYDVNEMISIGGAYSSNSWFQDFEFNSMYENPNREDFGLPRDISFRMDVPAVLGAGIGINATPDTVIGVDWKYIFYGSTKGFELENSNMPFDQTGAVTGFGWESINVFAAGVRHTVRPGINVRAGYNFSQNPVPDELSFFNIPAPAIVKHHLTLGAGMQVSPTLTLDFGYYHAFQNEGTGQMWNLMGPMPGSSVTNQMKENSFQMMFSFTPGGGS